MVKLVDCLLRDSVEEGLNHGRGGELKSVYIFQTSFLLSIFHLDSTRIIFAILALKSVRAVEFY